MADDMLSSLKSLLGDNADEKINAVLGMLKSNTDNENKESVDDSIKISEDKKPIPISLGNNNSGNKANNFFSPEGLEYMAKFKGIIDEMGSVNDQRSNLLMSLRPYMRNNRQKSIDNAIKILNLSKFSGLFNL